MKPTAGRKLPERRAESVAANRQVEQLVGRDEINRSHKKYAGLVSSQVSRATNPHTEETEARA